MRTLRTTASRQEQVDVPIPSGPDQLAARPDEDRRRSVLWPAGDIADTGKALAAAAAPWTKAVADFTSWQIKTLQQMACAVDGGLAGSAGPRPSRSRTGASPGRPGAKDPRFEAVVRTYLTQTELLHKALDAAPLDERSKAQWGFALRQVIDALSPANTLATNPEALQLAMETGGASLVDGMRLFTEDLAQGPDLDDRRDGVRGGPQRRHDAGHAWSTRTS